MFGSSNIQRNSANALRNPWSPGFLRSIRWMFAIDGVKLPGNAPKARTGTRGVFIERAAKLENEAGKMLARHREADAGVEPAIETHLHHKHAGKPGLGAMYFTAIRNAGEPGRSS